MVLESVRVYIPTLRLWVSDERAGVGGGGCGRQYGRGKPECVLKVR